ncbi:pyruvate, water dikinase regulatory protein [Oceanibium sediminis]|uniref:pyruvate, water dikinase regulatory protein n=1 Tax=Oceanibium sediminis TaxID=2026339 RepID=UPI000DD40C3B|nr:pyruvate, water dikinase regulatory protein [Oceanibium sediminis]
MAQEQTRALCIVLLSDSTGETVSAAVRAAVSQFAVSDVHYRLYPFLRKPEDFGTIPASVLDKADLIAFTLVNPDLKSLIEAEATRRGIPAIPVLDPLIEGIASVIGAAPSTRPGQQYRVNRGYLDRVTAIDFAITHDDGLSEDHLMSADVILAGVSRTSKTPTCIYLGYQGIKAANVPLIPGQPTPVHLEKAIAAKVPTVGLTVSPLRLMQIRQTRLKTLGSAAIDTYTNREKIEEELVAARLFFDRHNLPVIDVTRRSIEETAAAIRHYLSNRTAE